MASKRKPLDDARRRVKEKLSAIDEQKDFIQNSLEQLTCGVKHAANSLLTESNKTKFFQKYRAVSQELEKCLDDLLFISARISSLEDEEEEEDVGSEEDDEPPDQQSPTTSHEENSPVKNFPKLDENEHVSCETTVKSLPTVEKPTLLPSPAGTTKDLIDFETQTPNAFVKESIPKRSQSCSSDLDRDNIDRSNNALNDCQQAFNVTERSTHEVKGNEIDDNSSIPVPTKEQASLAFDLVDISEPTLEKPTSLQLLQVCEKNTEKNNERKSPKDKAMKSISIDSSLDSTSYVNDLFLSSPPLDLRCETEAVHRRSRASSFETFVENSGEMSSKNLTNEVGNRDESSSPTTVRLKRIGFCEYKSHAEETTVEVANDIEEPNILGNEGDELTQNENNETEKTVDESEKLKITASYVENRKTTANDFEKLKISANNIQKPKTILDENDSKMFIENDKTKMSDISKATKTLNQDEKSGIGFETALSQTTEKTGEASPLQECIITSNESKIEISGQPVTSPCWDEGKSQGHVQKVVAGDVIEEALKEKLACELADVKGPRIPPFDIPTDKCCIKVTVKDIQSPNDFWIQKANDDLDLLMEKMCYHFSKRAKSGDKGGLKELPGIGHVCCGRYSVDNVWYRALVTAVSRANSHVTVLYVDEGNSETLPLSRLRELDEKFASLPCQSLRVQLRGLELSEDVDLEEVNDWLKRRVSGETLDAVVYENEADVSPVCVDLYIRLHSRSVSDVDHYKLEYNIHEMLIREGFAIRAASPQSTGTSDDVTPPSSPSDQVVKSESIVSSSVTSGFHDAPSPVLDVNNDVVTSPGSHGDGVVCRVPPPHIPVDSDGSVYMLVSHIVTPGEFYVHFISSEAGMLDCLMTNMNQTYKDLESQDSACFSPRVGDFCCAKFSADGNWYRGLILQVRCSGDSADNSITVDVFYIDFGNIEQVHVKDLRELLPQFMSIPVQVVRCSLADVYPSIKQELDCDVFDEDLTSEDDRKSRSSRQRSRRNKRADTQAIVIAAGDEDSEDEITTGDMDQLGILPDIEKHDQRDRLRSSISEDIAKSYQEQSLFSDTAVELFQKNWSGVEEISLKPNWCESATEYLKTLTLNAEKLFGYVVPWDSEMLNNIVNYSQGGECSLPNLGPVLRLNLYDVSGDNDVFINAAMVRAKYASSNSIKDEQVDDVNVSTTEDTSESFEDSLAAVPVVRVSQDELSNLAETSQDSTSTPPSSLDPSSPSSPLSPTSQLLDAWNPMSYDYKAFRNAYNVETDNLDVAITGYEEDRGKICRFYRTKYGCFRGSKCPNKHIEQDVSDKVFIFGSAANTMKLPDVGTWVLVKITAIYNPSHFWVQLPSGVENLTSQLIKLRSGKETSGEENLKDFNSLMKEMCEFYSKTFRRERSLVPPSQGELVVARSKVDNKWYRGQVCQEEKSNNKYKILFVDYGITEFVDRTSIRPILPQFLHLPFQSVECYLANIKPKSGNWTEESREHFISLIVDKALVCQVLAIGSLNKTIIVNLFESVTDGEPRNIAEQMIESDYADEAKFKTPKSVDLESRCANKSVIVHPG